MNKRPILFHKKPLALGVAAALLAMSASSQAASWRLGDVDIQFDSTFSYGASWRTSERDWDSISKVNHPRFDWAGYNAGTNNILYTPQDIWAQPGAYSSNGDAGNLNFDRGDMFSNMLKGTHDLSIRKDNIGFFGRFMYFYDFAQRGSNYAYTNPLSEQQVNPCNDKRARELSCRDFRLLDAYIYGNFALNDGMNPLTVRLGQQVLSWGESTFIPHGINITPVDVGILRAPGSDLKEAFIPVGMLTMALGITDNLSAEVFYQYDWENSYLPAPGTYFSTNDFAGAGGHNQNIQLGFAGNPDIDLYHVLANLNNISTMLASGAINAQTAVGMYLQYPTKVALRPHGNNGELKPKNGGQYGVKFEYFSPELNDTEFAVYYMNYHSRVPLISGRASNFNQAAIMQDIGYLAQNAGQIDKDTILNLQAFAHGLLEYPEDIKLYGFSFNTTVGTTSVAGEIAHRRGEPLQIDDVEILYAGMPEQLANSDGAWGRPELAGISQIGRFDGNKVQPGAMAKGYIERDTTQAQMTFTHLFGPVLGTDNFTMLAEVGGIKIHSMPDHEVLRLNGPNTDRSGAPLIGANGPSEGLHTALSDGPEPNPFPTASAWGYRVFAQAQYNNVFAGTNMTHRVNFAHDVNGITPDPLFMFVKGRKSLGYTLGFDYLNRWSAELSYNWFWGGVGTTNNLADRDFVSFNIKYSI
ncbi:DUF1302 domain-containing protein [Alkalimonas sp. MEB108]|uniref:DUF1302 domain-containing protein n=1 Tax=Alkalimonas cellulosilytica TaxID=3058395 RepID=A0ABU7J1Y3_9GAMM|nr:DUF1302 domain-containing protein [Alkalimonas sp. MEB108]MEE2000504.1 DUF1302 domain-containing protein [Alkalimonas sp. MEB108]